MLTATEKFEWFTETLNHCGCFLLHASDEEIEYHLFEEFDGDCRSFLCEDNLRQLRDAGYMDHAVTHAAHSLAEQFLRLEHTALWNVQAVKTAPEWLAVLSLADHIRALIRS